jgi:hypothetical protein
MSDIITRHTAPKVLGRRLVEPCDDGSAFSLKKGGETCLNGFTQGVLEGLAYSNQTNRAN